MVACVTQPTVLIRLKMLTVMCKKTINISALTTSKEMFNMTSICSKLKNILYMDTNIDLPAPSPLTTAPLTPKRKLINHGNESAKVDKNFPAIELTASKTNGTHITNYSGFV